MSIRPPCLLALLLGAAPSLMATLTAHADVDDDTVLRVRRALAAAQISEAPQLAITVFNGAAVLAGVVHSEGTRQKAERVAATVRGVSVVRNDLSVGVANVTGDDTDAVLAGRVRRALAAAGIREEPQLAVTAFNGEVEIAGSVHSAATRDRILRMTGALRGVTAVRDALVVRPDGSATAVDGDEAITARVQRALAASALGDVSHVEIRTFHGEVDVSGSVASEYARGEVERLVGTIRGVTSVHDALTIPGH